MRKLSQVAPQGLHEAGSGDSPNFASRAQGLGVLLDADSGCSPGSFLGRAAGGGALPD
jgi:hypothetical protein